MARVPVLLFVALGVAVAVAWAAMPPRLSFAVAVPPSAPDGFDGYGDAETLAAGDLNGDGRLDLALGSAQDRRSGSPSALAAASPSSEPSTRSTADRPRSRSVI